MTVRASGALPTGGPEVLAALQGFTEDLSRVLSGPGQKVTSQWATPAGQALLDTRAAVVQRSGSRSQGPVGITARVTVTGDQAQVSGCLDQSRVVIVDSQGQQSAVDARPALPLQVTLRRGQARWLVDTYTVTNAAGC